MPGARERIALVADDGRLEAWDEDVVSDDPLDFSDVRPYSERLADAREKTGLSEAVLTGLIGVEGRPLAVVAGEFGFLGGSIGVATGERVARAIERAIDRRLPVLALPASGGTRMQEGAPALMQMAKLADAARRLREAGLLYLVCLMHPTTGGVLASWGSLGHVTWAEPDALIGFGGPRVVEMLTGAPLPEDVQRAERMLERGLLDDIVAPRRLRERVRRALAVTESPAVGAATAVSTVEVASGRRVGLASSVRATRRGRRPPTCSARGRPTSRRCAATAPAAATIPPCLAALARVRGIPCVVARPAARRDGAGGLPQGAPGDRDRRGARPADPDDRRHARGGDERRRRGGRARRSRSPDCLAAPAPRRRRRSPSWPARAAAAARSRCSRPTAWSPPSTRRCMRSRPRARRRSSIATTEHAAELAATPGRRVVGPRALRDRRRGRARGAAGFAERLGAVVEAELRALAAQRSRRPARAPRGDTVSAHEDHRGARLRLVARARLGGAGGSADARQRAARA